MRLLQIETENVLGLPDGTHRFAKAARDSLAGATVITGPSGSGKTSLLAAIVFGREALAGYGPPERPERLLRYGAAKGSLRIAFELDDAEVLLAEVDDRTVDLSMALGPNAPPPVVSKSLRRLFSRFGESAARGALEYFPDNRSLDAAGSRTALDQEKRLRPGRARHKYAGLIPWLHALAVRSAAESEVLTPMRVALKHLAPGLELLGLDAREEPELLFSLGGATVPLSRLSSSQSQAVVFAGTLIRFALETGLVLVDQPELHHSTADHAGFLRGLAEVARDAQLIIATGSTEIAAAVRQSQLIHLDRLSTAGSVNPLSAPLETARAQSTSASRAAAVPSALETPGVATTLPAPNAPSSALIVAPPADDPPPPHRESNRATPSYLQQQARTPAPYVPIAEAPAPIPPATDLQRAW